MGIPDERHEVPQDADASAPARQAAEASPERAAEEGGPPEPETTPSTPPGAAPQTAPHTTPREFRATELAEEAGITPRTLRFYRERKLLPPPRRAGRIAWYDEHHLARLRTIAALLARGHTLGGIADLLSAFEQGRVGHSAAELLGLETMFATPFSEEIPVRLSPEDLAGYFADDITTENLADSLDIGYVAVDGDEIVHVSRRLLDASAALVQEGIPLSAVLAAGRQLRVHTDAIAAVFSDVVRTHLLSGELSGTDAERISHTLERVNPLAKEVVQAELGLAMDRRVRAELDAWLEDSPAEE
ncbi:MerR family transcriptional regulator [Streptomyces sp. N2-109]|uniref:MerR family transcriptional regulator n=1 Tax=Streptomyces gossypii TaxID=2883101 RepID=A0ABT2K0A0_9ACTN|nr:MerR family transcriptional regulator [Streptomyces gossypii]MCT2593059.1 MerR family transcriptional regulator [Streptomyces gossypii]